jgi:hypothetical protein
MRMHPTSSTLCFVAAAVVAACGGAACGGASAGGDADGDRDVEATCVALAEMQARSRSIEQVDVADPAAFARELDRAVELYTEELGELRKVAPEQLHEPIDRLDRAVGRHDFDAALRARAPLDAYVTTECATASSSVTTGAS